MAFPLLVARRARLVVFLSTGVAGVAGVAEAAPRTPDAAASEALFIQGRAAMKEGDYARACAKFEESETLDPTAPGTLLNLAECEEKQGKLASAWQRLRQALDSLPPHDDRVGYAAEHARGLEPRVPKLLLRFAPGSPSTAHVQRDKVDLGPAAIGVPLPVDPGHHEILVTAEGRRARKFTIDLREGEAREVLVDVGAIETPSVPISAPGRRAAGLALLGVGTTAIGLGAVMGVLAIGRDHYMSAHCNGARVCDGPDALAAGAAGRTYAAVSTVSLIGGAALVVIGGYLVLSGRADTPKATASLSW